jgi:hypothetical protein
MILTHISSQIRTIPIRAVCLMSVPLHNNIYVRMLDYQRKNEVRNLSKFCVNLISITVCALAWKLLSSIILNKKFGTNEGKKICTDLKRKSRILSLFSQQKLWEKRRCIINVCQCIHCSKEKVWQRQFIYHFSSWITWIKTNMLLITFLGLIAKLTSNSGDCEFGTQEVKDFDYIKLGISVLIWFLFLVLIVHLCFQ